MSYPSPVVRLSVQKILLTFFGIACIVAAFNSAADMFVTFAPADPSAGFAAGESEAMERIRNYFAPSTFVASGLLTAAGVCLSFL